MSGMNTLTIKIPPDLLMALDAVAARAHQTRSDVVRQALHALVQQEEATAPANKLLGALPDLVGCFGGGPRDLSSNPAHLAEFGKH